LLLLGEQSAGTSFDGVLFLNGTDLWLANAQGNQNAYRVTRGYRVRQFAQSPDLASVAFAAADPNNDNDPWARSIYLTRISSSGPATPIALLSGMEVHDLAWYSDRELLALARSGNGSLAIYKISLPTTRGAPTTDNAAQVEQVVSLPDSLSGAKSLAVSPDRQLITFLAPVGERKGTDLYGVRPDGTDLLTLISHSDP